MPNKKIMMLNDGRKEVNVLVYLKKVKVKSNYTRIKAFCRMVNQ